jgi:hypothetical protein
MADVKMLGCRSCEQLDPVSPRIEDVQTRRAGNLVRIGAADLYALTPEQRSEVLQLGW